MRLRQTKQATRRAGGWSQAMDDKDILEGLEEEDEEEDDDQFEDGSEAGSVKSAASPKVGGGGMAGKRGRKGGRRRRWWARPCPLTVLCDACRCGVAVEAEHGGGSAGVASWHGGEEEPHGRGDRDGGQDTPGGGVRRTDTEPGPRQNMTGAPALRTGAGWSLGVAGVRPRATASKGSTSG